MSEELQNEITENQDTISTNEGLNIDDNSDNSDNTDNTDNTDSSENTDSQNNNKENGSNEDIYGSPESFDYSEVQLPENMELDKELIEEFNPIAKKFNLSNKSANELMNLAVKLTQKNTAKFANEFAAQLQDAESKSYMQLLNTDKELNAYSAEEYDQYLKTANLGLKSFATDGFKNLLKQKGLTNHPEFIKTFHAIGKFCQNDSLPDVKNPVGEKRSAADILYGSSES